MRPRNRGQETGLALPAAIWATLIFFLMTASILNLTLGQKQQVFTKKTMTERELTAEAAFMTAIKALHDDRTGDKKALLATPVKYTRGDFDVTVTISAEAGKVNLNLAEKDLLASLFIEAGIGRAEAETFAERIVDFRQTDRPFKTLNELLKIRGMTQELFLDLEPDLTLYSDRALVRADFASPRLLRVLAAMGEDFTGQGSSVLKPAEFETGTTWRLEAIITNPEWSPNKKTWIIRLTGNDKKPYLLHWVG